MATSVTLIQLVTVYGRRDPRDQTTYELEANDTAANDNHLLRNRLQVQRAGGRNNLLLVNLKKKKNGLEADSKNLYWEVIHAIQNSFTIR